MYEYGTDHEYRKKKIVEDLIQDEIKTHLYVPQDHFDP